jgi:hypothetical protein
MNETPRTPDGIKAWVESLSPEQVRDLAESMASGGLGSLLDTEAPGPFGRRNPYIELPEPPQVPVLLTVHVRLDGSEPAVWRRLTIPGDLDLGAVHDVLQQAMGWTDSHLHRFLLGPPFDSPYFVTEFDLDEGEEGRLETDARLDQVLREPGDTMTYEYDFGDSWTHVLTLEAIEPRPDLAPSGADEAAEADPAPYPLVCLGGAGACPPEDVGGLPGHAEVAAWVSGGEDETYEFDSGLTAAELRAWLPEGWHPDHFDLDEVNTALARLAPRDLETALGQLPRELSHLITSLSTAARFEVDDWLAAPGWGDPVAFTDDETAVLTAPYRIVLDAVGEGLTLTAAGYLPPHVVETIIHALHLDDLWIGAGNRESQAWPVHELRARTRRYGLIRKAKGRLLPTAQGRRLRADPVALLDLVLTRIAHDGEEFERVAAGLMLLGVAGGAQLEPGDEWWATARSIAEPVSRMIAIAGWRREDRTPPDRDDVLHASRDTLHAVLEMARCMEGDAESVARVLRRLARAVLQRMG